MKPLHVLLAAAPALLALAPITTLQAEALLAPGATAEAPSEEGRHCKPHKPFPPGHRLTEEERAKLKAVRDQVMAAHPEFATEAAALKERAASLREKLHALMIAANPAVKPILEKLEAGRKGHADAPEEDPTAIVPPAAPEPRDADGADAKCPPGHKPILTPKEKELLDQTRHQVLEANPDLAKDLRAVHEARRALRHKIVEAMIALDPSVKEILAKLHRPPYGHRPGRPGRPGGHHGPGDAPEPPAAEETPTVFPSGT
jgi:Spy/CpxP family protein refolding chaperone